MSQITNDKIKESESSSVAVYILPIMAAFVVGFMIRTGVLSFSSWYSWQNNGAIPLQVQGKVTNVEYRIGKNSSTQTSVTFTAKGVEKTVRANYPRKMVKKAWRSKKTLSVTYMPVPSGGWLILNLKEGNRVLVEKDKPSYFSMFVVSYIPLFIILLVGVPLISIGVKAAWRDCRKIRRKIYCK